MGSETARQTDWEAIGENPERRKKPDRHVAISLLDPTDSLLT